MKFIFTFLFVLLASGASADDAVLSGCKPIVVSGESVMLSTKKPGLVMIHNLSSVDLWITHPVSEPSASAGWSTRLQAGHWSALMLDKESFELSCIESKPGHEQQVPCAGAVSVCQWAAATPSADAAGTFWAGEDMALPALTTYLGDRGFGLPTAPQ